MFKDYYSALEIEQNSNLDEIKKAFKVQALKWHPDRNPNIDTTSQMQEINEAYLILKDKEARERYDLSFNKFKEFKRRQRDRENYFNQKTQHKKTESYYTYRDRSKAEEFVVEDDILEKWMDNAKKQAVDLAKQTIKDFKGMAYAGAKAAAKEAGNQFVYQLIIGILFLLIFSITKAC